MATDYEKKYKEALERAKKMMESKREVVVEKQALETIFPELAESEDERIRKDIVAAVEMYGDFTQSRKEEIYSYLERQKDSASNNFDDVWNEEDCEDIIAEGQKLTPRFKELLKEVCHAWYDRGAKLEKQKEASKAIEAVDRIDKYIDEHLANAHDMKDSNPDKKYYRGWDDALGEMARILQDVYSGEKQKGSLRDFIDDFPYSAEQKEQKPAEWSEDYREEGIQTRFAFYTYKDDLGTLYLSNVFVEEASRNHGFGTRILIAAEKVAETIGATTISLKVKQDSPANAWYRKNGYGYVAFEDGYDWLEKNLEYMKPNKQEWSEEGKRKLNRIYEIIGQAADEQPFGSSKRIIGDKEAVELQDFIKSLRPQPKVEWDTHDKAIVTCIACCLDGQFVSEAARKKCLEWFNKHRRDFLNSPSWKPSEEQMEALLSTLHPDDPYYCELRSLYKQLKKL